MTLYSALAGYTVAIYLIAQLQLYWQLKAQGKLK